MSRRHRNAHPCPTASKIGYCDRIAADLAMARIRTESGHGRAKLPVRSYRCECGRWHLTSMSKERAVGG